MTRDLPDNNNETVVIAANDSLDLPTTLGDGLRAALGERDLLKEDLGTSFVSFRDELSSSRNKRANVLDAAVIDDVAAGTVRGGRHCW
jgi:hypothetical protein